MTTTNQDELYGVNLLGLRRDGPDLRAFDDFDEDRVIAIGSEPANPLSHSSAVSYHDRHKDTRSADSPTPTPRSTNIHQEEESSVPPMHIFKNPFAAPSPAKWIDRRTSLPANAHSQLDDSARASTTSRKDRAGSDGQNVQPFGSERRLGREQSPEITESLCNLSMRVPPSSTTSTSVRSPAHSNSSLPSQTPSAASITSSQKSATKVKFPKLGFTFPPPAEPQPRRVPLKQTAQRPNGPKPLTSVKGISNADVVDGRVPRSASIALTKSDSGPSMTAYTPPALSPPPLSHSPFSATSSLPSASLGQLAPSSASLDSSVHSMRKDHPQRHSVSAVLEPYPATHHDKTTWSLFDEIEQQDKISRKTSLRKTKPERTTAESVFDQHTPPRKKALYEAGLVEVIGDDGESVPFARLVQRKTIVVFIRHWFCPLCAQYIQSIIRQVRQEALDEAGVDLVIIGNGSAKMLSAYKNKALHCPFRMYTDPTLALYRTLGLSDKAATVATDEQVGDYLTQTTLESTFSTLRRAVKMPLRNPGHFFQLGAEFIYENPLKVSFTHRMGTTRDHLPISDICDIAGVRLEWVHYEPGPPPPSIHRLSIIEHDIILEDDESIVDWRAARDVERERIRQRKEERRAGMRTKTDVLGLAVDLEDLVSDEYQDTWDP